MRLRCAIILVVGVSFGGGIRGVWVLCKRAPATLYLHHTKVWVYWLPSIDGLISKRLAKAVVTPASVM